MHAGSVEERHRADHRLLHALLITAAAGGSRFRLVPTRSSRSLEHDRDARRVEERVAESAHDVAVRRGDSLGVACCAARVHDQRIVLRRDLHVGRLPALGGSHDLLQPEHARGTPALGRHIIGVPADDHSPQPRHLALPAEGQEALRPLPVHKGYCRARVDHAVLDLVRQPQGVRRHPNATDLRAGHEREHPLGVVAGALHDAIALLHTQLLHEESRQSAGGLVGLGIRIPFCAAGSIRSLVDDEWRLVEILGSEGVQVPKHLGACLEDAVLLARARRSLQVRRLGGPIVGKDVSLLELEGPAWARKRLQRFLCPHRRHVVGLGEDPDPFGEARYGGVEELRPFHRLRLPRLRRHR
mmetsp:Transcript_39693/g.84695  ORF Transcript_39693/g.84695 Transcript_39693/m.84695 type:complete len:356 (+) Transcript_39693:215-1282(+)